VNTVMNLRVLAPRSYGYQMIKIDISVEFHVSDWYYCVFYRHVQEWTGTLFFTSFIQIFFVFVVSCLYGHTSLFLPLRKQRREGV
jgi:hypothetical protein